MGVKIKIPADWRAVSIGQFQQITGISGSRNMLELDKHIAVISVLSGLPAETIERLPFIELMKLVQATSWIAEPPTDTRLKAWQPDRFTRYTCVTDARHISGGDFITLQELTGAGVIDNLDKILAVLCVKEVLTWRGWKRVELTAKEFELRADEFCAFMPVSFAYPCALFFSAVLTQFLEITQTSLAKKEASLRKMKAKAEKQAAIRGDGSQ